MAFSSLQETLGRLKSRWKKRRHNPSNNSSPESHETSAVNNIRATGATIGPEENTTIPTQALDGGANRTKRVEVPSWSGLGDTLRTLEPAQQLPALSELAETISHFEQANRVSGEYDELIKLLFSILSILKENFELPIGPSIASLIVSFVRDVQAELENIQRLEQNHPARGFPRRKDIEKCYRRIHALIERLTLSISMYTLRGVNSHLSEARLNGMSPAKSAIYNMGELYGVERNPCAPGTRVVAISQLLKWMHHPGGGGIFWVNGMAGTGKTTIAYTVCSELERKAEFNANFFCSRKIPECRQVKNIIPSFAYQLARWSLPFSRALFKALEADPDAHARPLDVQFQKLISNPLIEVRDSIPGNAFLVIDALDECEDDNNIGHILELFSSTTRFLPIRLLVFSRPERTIHRRMVDRQIEGGAAQLTLHELDRQLVKTDIEIYVRHRLNHISLADSHWSIIIRQSGILFAYAAALCRYIEQSDDREGVDDALNAIASPNSLHVEHQDELMNELYLGVLENAFVHSRMSKLDQIMMRKILETVACAVEPIALETIAAVLGLASSRRVMTLLWPLRPVLNVSDATGLVGTIHPSFLDFIISSKQSGDFHLDLETRNTAIATACLKIIDVVEPKFNICNLPSSYLSDEEVEDLDERVSQAIKPALLYACRHWSAHLYLGKQKGDEVIDATRNFFSRRLLLWMEIINLTKNMRFGTHIIHYAEQWSREQDVPNDLVKMVYDAEQFISVYANHPISQSTPHIYVSMLPLWPHYRPVSQAYIPRTVGVVRPSGSAMDERPIALLGTWKGSGQEAYSTSLSADGARLAVATGNGLDIIETSTGVCVNHLSEERTIGVRSVAISPDGIRIIFGSQYYTFCLWDTTPGPGDTDTEVLVLSALDSEVYCVAFSPDGSRVACGTKNGNVYICIPQQQSHVLGPLKVHTNHVLSITFSPHGRYVATSSADNHIQVCDAITGHDVGGPIIGHTDMVRSISYSPDGSRLASASDDGTIRILSMETRDIKLVAPKGPRSRVLSVAFSPNGQLVASGFEDKTIRVYDALTGEITLGPLHGHTHWVNSVSFSPDGTRLFSGSLDGTIRVWNIQDPYLKLLEGRTSGPILPSPVLAVRYSHSASQIATGSSNGIVHAWSVHTGRMILGPLCGHTDSVAAIDYSPDDIYIVSASWDGTLRIWNSQDGKDMYGPMQSHSDTVYCVRFSPNRPLMVSGSGDGKVKVWDISSGRLIGALFEGNNAIHSVEFSLNGHVVIGSADGTIRVLDQETSQLIAGPYEGHRGLVSSIEFSTDGSRILSCSYDKSISVLDTYTGRIILALTEHGAECCRGKYMATFSSDCKFILSCSGAGTIRVWDAQTGRLILGPFLAHSSSINDAQFSPDGSHIVTCSDDHSIRFWFTSGFTASRQGNKVKIPDEETSEDCCAGSDQSEEDTPSWYLTQHSWVGNSTSPKALYILPDLHNHVARFPNNLSIVNGGSLRLEFDGIRIGESWGQCYKPWVNST
ncbi:unnamed protein product [Rhizoctonia solani]|uniref:NACHT domain-containing protein n=1 Tax=Rhizoctonia solani TaxID=456999 RepID=A0A8H2XR75_9AGAM|nr:unnamed protein product [Rhizoctonia solani]